ncbi:CRTAC1 family protein [Pelagibacterium limicola]|uniref:CRTAC1 family protein n=1 Tax=Pelagibacterium limicola TaxID=2791022 RepID=UPI0018B0087B|nr:CRTAC1 family protein [Pelagibacterium limicola]
MQRVIVFGLTLAGYVSTAWAQDPVVPRYEEVTAKAGISHVFEGEWEYMVGGGAAVFDCDGDGLPGMLLAGGSAPAVFYRNKSEPGGALAFEAQQSGLELDAVTGAYPIDIDSDGIMDVVVLRVGENVLMRGLGECRFERANEAWGFDGGDAWSTAFAATWERDSDWPTLAVGNYVDRSEPMFPWGSCTDNWLHRPAAGGFAAPIALKPSYCSLSMMFTDWDRSGTPSLRVSNDREYYKGGQEQLWKVRPGETPALFGADEGWRQLRIWGMGIASADLDFNGYPEYFLTSMTDNRLQVLAPVGEGEVPLPTYVEAAFPRGVTAHRPYTGDEIRPSTAWHPQFEDVNNDGLMDLFIAKGNVWEMPDFALEDPNNLLLQRPDGTFMEAGDIAGVASMLTARGAMLADFNLDGLIDILVVNRHAETQLWQNVSDIPGGWLQVALHQEGGNRDGIGSWTEVRRGEVIMRREVFVGGGHVSGHAGWWHFGLGDAEDAEIRVLWPGGEASEWYGVEANGFYRVTRGAGITRWAADADTR